MKTLEKVNISFIIVNTLKNIVKFGEIIISILIIIFISLILIVPDFMPEVISSEDLILLSITAILLVQLNILFITKKRKDDLYFKKWDTIHKASVDIINCIKTEMNNPIRIFLKNKLIINIGGGKLEYIMPNIVYIIIEDIINERIKAKWVEINIFCLSPDFMYSLKNSIWEESNINRYFNEVKQYYDKIEEYNNNEIMKKFEIKLFIQEYKTFPRDYFFTIGSKAMYWSNFLLLENNKDFNGTNSPVYYLDNKNKEYIEKLKNILNEIALYNKSNTLSYINNFALKQISETNRVAFEKSVPYYKNIMETHKERYIEISKSILKYLSKDENDDILEIGSGNGQILLNLKKFGIKNLTAIEYSKKIVSATKYEKDIKVIYDDFFEHNFGNKKYSFIIAIAFIHLFPTIYTNNILSKIYELLKENGYAYIVTTIHEKSEEGFCRKENGVVRYRKHFLEKELEKYISEERFIIVDTEIQNDKYFAYKIWKTYIIKKV